MYIYIYIFRHAEVGTACLNVRSAIPQMPIPWTTMPIGTTFRALPAKPRCRSGLRARCSSWQGRRGHAVLLTLVAAWLFADYATAHTNLSTAGVTNRCETSEPARQPARRGQQSHKAQTTISQRACTPAFTCRESASVLCCNVGRPALDGT